MRVYYVQMLFNAMFSRYDFINITQEDVENLFLQLPKYLVQYVKYALDEHLLTPVFTSNFDSVIQECQKNKNVCLCGPKGCGKTFTLVVMFLLCYKKGNRCLFLTPKSMINDVATKRYLNETVREFITDTAIQKQIQDEVKSGNISEAVGYTLMYISLKMEEGKGDREVFVFVDLSKISSNKPVDLISALLTFNDEYRIILSISSGAEGSGGMKDTEMITFREIYNKFITPFQFVSIKAFTEEEATKFLQKKNSSLKLDQVKHLSGTNPLLLSQIRKNPHTSVNSYKSALKNFVEMALINELGNVSKEIKTLKDYFMQKKMLECRKFAYYAIREDVLTIEEQKSYQLTFLHDCNLTVLEDGHLVKVLEDEEEASEGIMEEATAKDQVISQSQGVPQILRWNFPIAGEMFIDILTEFVATETDDQVARVCKKVPSFAGFWYEALFFQHHQKRKSEILIHYSRPSDGDSEKTSDLKLSISDTASLDLLDSKLERGILYEMRVCYPIIDAVGLLDDDDRKPWLVFIQVSLAEYVNHRSLCDLFHRAPKYSEVPGNISIFTHFKRLYNIKTNDNVLLVYVSPKEKKASLLPKLKEEIKQLSTKSLRECVHRAVLSEQSTFHKFYETKDYFSQYNP